MFLPAELYLNVVVNAVKYEYISLSSLNSLLLMTLCTVLL